MTAKLNPLDKKLLQENPLLVLPSLAVKLGLNGAIMIQQLQYWLANLKVEGITLDGEKWISMTQEEWQANFPFWAPNTIRNIKGTLVKEGLILERYDPEKPTDRRKYYRIDYNKLEKKLTDLVVRKPRKPRAYYPNFGQWANTRKTAKKETPPITQTLEATITQTLEDDRARDSLSSETTKKDYIPKPEPPKLSKEAKAVKHEIDKYGVAIAKTEAERKAELDLIELGKAASIGCARGVKAIDPALQVLQDELKPLADNQESPAPAKLTGASFLQAWVDTVGKERFPRTMEYKTLGGAAKNLIKAHADLTVDDIKQDAALYKAYLDGLNGSCPVLEWSAPQFISLFKLADNMAHQAITPVMVKWYVEEEKKAAFWVGKTISFQHVANNVLSAIKERNPHLMDKPAVPKPICPKCGGKGFIQVKDETGKAFGVPCDCKKAG